MSAAIAPEKNGAARPPPANTHTHPNTCHRDERAEEDGVRADEQERDGGRDERVARRGAWGPGSGFSGPRRAGRLARLVQAGDGCSRYAAY